MHTLGALAFWSLVAWIVLRWSAFPAAVRVWVFRLLLAAGVAVLGLAPLLEGGYTEEVVLYIGGPNPHAVEQVTRSYSGLAAGLGLILAALAALARWGARLPWQTPVGRAVTMTLAVLVLRVALERLGVPLAVAMFTGIIWLAAPLSVYLAWEAARSGRQSRYWLWLLGYTYTIRLLVLVIMLLATWLQLGTHFDNSGVTDFTVLGRPGHVDAGSWDQYRNLILLPQLLLWPAVTIVAGILFGWPTFFLARRRMA